MLSDSKAFSGFSTNDIPAAKAFYGETLGIEVTEENGMLTLHLAGGERPTLVYPKPDHEPAAFTILNFPVRPIADAVRELTDARRRVRPLRRDGVRRARDHARRRPADRLVQGPGREHPLGDRETSKRLRRRGSLRRALQARGQQLARARSARAARRRRSRPRASRSASPASRGRRRRSDSGSSDRRSPRVRRPTMAGGGRRSRPRTAWQRHAAS